MNAGLGLEYYSNIKLSFWMSVSSALLHSFFLFFGLRKYGLSVVIKHHVLYFALIIYIASYKAQYNGNSSMRVRKSSIT